MRARTPPADHLLVARIGAAHGIKGEVRLETFTEAPETILDYSPLATDRDGLHVAITSMRRVGGRTVATLRGISDRNAAEALTEVRLYVPRSALPEIEAEDEYYQADLLGLTARTAAGDALGSITGIFNFGAGDILEITPAGAPALMVPFSRERVPEVDVKGGVVTVVPVPETPAVDDDAEPGAASR